MKKLLLGLALAVSVNTSGAMRPDSDRVGDIAGIQRTVNFLQNEKELEKYANPIVFQGQCEGDWYIRLSNLVMGDGEATEFFTSMTQCMYEQSSAELAMANLMKLQLCLINRGLLPFHIEKATHSDKSKVKKEVTTPHAIVISDSDTESERENILGTERSDPDTGVEILGTVPNVAETEQLNGSERRGIVRIRPDGESLSESDRSSRNYERNKEALDADIDRLVFCGRGTGNLDALLNIVRSVPEAQRSEAEELFDAMIRNMHEDNNWHSVRKSFENLYKFLSDKNLLPRTQALDAKIDERIFECRGIGNLAGLFDVVKSVPEAQRSEAESIFSTMLHNMYRGDRSVYESFEDLYKFLSGINWLPYKSGDACFACDAVAYYVFSDDVCSGEQKSRNYERNKEALDREIDERIFDGSGIGNLARLFDLVKSIPDAQQAETMFSRMLHNMYVDDNWGDVCKSFDELYEFLSDRLLCKSVATLEDKRVLNAKIDKHFNGLGISNVEELLKIVMSVSNKAQKSKAKELFKKTLDNCKNGNWAEVNRYLPNLEKCLSEEALNVAIGRRFFNGLDIKELSEMFKVASRVKSPEPQMLFDKMLDNYNRRNWGEVNRYLERLYNFLLDKNILPSCRNGHPRSDASAVVQNSSNHEAQQGQNTASSNQGGGVRDDGCFSDYDDYEPLGGEESGRKTTTTSAVAQIPSVQVQTAGLMDLSATRDRRGEARQRSDAGIAQTAVAGNGNEQQLDVSSETSCIDIHISEDEIIYPNSDKPDGQSGEIRRARSADEPEMQRERNVMEGSTSIRNVPELMALVHPRYVNIAQNLSTGSDRELSWLCSVILPDGTRKHKSHKAKVYSMSEAIKTETKGCPFCKNEAHYRPIDLVDQEGNIIKQYPSITDAAKNLFLPTSKRELYNVVSGIGHVLNGDFTGYRGKRFVYTDGKGPYHRARVSDAEDEQ